MGLFFHDSPAHCAGAGNDHSAVLAAMRANTCGMGIGRNDGRAERMTVLLRSSQLSGLAGTGQREAGDNTGDVLLR